MATVPSLLSAVSGMAMPAIGLGTWRATNEEIEASLDAALEAGYRHIDTAFVYGNEAAIGKVLKKWLDGGKLKREDLFIVTKLPNTSMEAQYVEEAITVSLSNLQLSYVDLYLIHQPVGMAHAAGHLPRNPDGSFKLDMTTDLIAVWKAMEAQVDAGRAKAIGVSNFNTEQLQRILNSSRIPPSTNQIEMHAYCQRKEMQELSKKSGVTITAFSPLGNPSMEELAKVVTGKDNSIKFSSPMEDPVVARLAKAHGKSPAQILLRHLLQLNVAVIPKSRRPTNLQNNIKVFDFKLSPKDMKEMESLDKGNEGSRMMWFFNAISDHPECPYRS